MANQIGGIFPEYIHKGSNKSSHHKKQLISSSPFSPLVVLLVVLIGAIGILGTKLLEITVIKGEYYKELSSGNRIREKTIIAPRGIIYDRHGTVLVRNIPGNDGGVEREYVYGSSIAHASGYTGQISPEELKLRNSNLPDNKLYSSGDVVGKMGVEQSYEDTLRGIDGKKLVEVDAKGDFIRNMGSVDPKPGNNLHLTLDLDLQKIASSSMLGRKGAIVASIPRTGEILALYSSPSFDPNSFSQNGDVERILDDPDMPLFDRAIAGTYPPGSTFKIVNAVASLESGMIKPSTQVDDVGILQVGRFSFPNWYYNQYGKKEGMVDIVKALKRSNDIFFYKAAEAIGIETLTSWEKKMGLGALSGIDIEGEAEGLVPDPVWKKEAKGEQWYLGDTYHVAIGQGDLLTTPLQVNNWTNVIARGGELCRPHLVGFQKQACKKLGIKKETIDLVREGMKEACSSGGTGWPLFQFSVVSSQLSVDGVDFLESPESTISGKRNVLIPTACKTGTAEFGDRENRTHAWFTVFAPIYHPQISITVVVEGAGEGSSIAAPIARDMLTEWFSR